MVNFFLRELCVHFPRFVPIFWLQRPLRTTKDTTNKIKNLNGFELNIDKDLYEKSARPVPNDQ